MSTRDVENHACLPYGRAIAVNQGLKRFHAAARKLWQYTENTRKKTIAIAVAVEVSSTFFGTQDWRPVVLSQAPSPPSSETPTGEVEVRAYIPYRRAIPAGYDNLCPALSTLQVACASSPCTGVVRSTVISTIVSDRNNGW